MFDQNIKNISTFIGDDKWNIFNFNIEGKKIIFVNLKN